MKPQLKILALASVFLFLVIPERGFSQKQKDHSKMIKLEKNICGLQNAFARI